MITRSDYMNGRATFEQYYRSVCCSAGIDMRESGLLPKVRQALAEGDEHLNTIPLRTWDMRAANPVLNAALHRAFKAHGDGYSMAGAVCALKQAAKDAVNAEGE